MKLHFRNSIFSENKFISFNSKIEYFYWELEPGKKTRHKCVYETRIAASRWENEHQKAHQAITLVTRFHGISIGGNDGQYEEQFTYTQQTRKRKRRYQDEVSSSLNTNIKFFLITHI